MANITQQDIERYAELKRFEKSISEEIKTLGSEIKSELELTKSEGVDVGDGSRITLSSKSLWEYSENVKQLEKTLKKQMEREQADGTATPKQTTFIVFREAK